MIKKIRPTKNVALIILLAFFSISLLVMMYTLLLDRGNLSKLDPKSPPDFLMYYVGATVAKNMGYKHLYNLNSQKEVQDNIVSPSTIDGLLAFRVPPTTAAFLKPLAHLSYYEAFYSLLAINLTLLIMIYVAYFKIETLSKKIILFSILVFPFFMAFWENLYNGQLSIFILLAMVLFYYLISRKNYFLAGVCITILAIKPQFMIMLPLLLALYSGKIGFRKLFTGILLASLCWLLINTLLYGINFSSDYIKYLLASESSEYGTNVSLNYNASSIISLFAENHKTINSLNIIVNGIIYLYVFGFLLVKSKVLDRNLAFSTIVMLTPLLNLHTMPVDIVVLHLPAIVLCSYLYNKGYTLYSFLLGLTFILASMSGYWDIIPYATLFFVLLSLWILTKKSFLGGDGGIRTPVLKA